MPNVVYLILFSSLSNLLPQFFLTACGPSWVFWGDEAQRGWSTSWHRYLAITVYEARFKEIDGHFSRKKASFMSSVAPHLLHWYLRPKISAKGLDVPCECLKNVNGGTSFPAVPCSCAFYHREKLADENSDRRQFINPLAVFSFFFLHPFNLVYKLTIRGQGRKSPVRAKFYISISAV